MRWVWQMLTAALACAACTGDIGDNDSESGFESEVGSNPGTSTSGERGGQPTGAGRVLGQQCAEDAHVFEYRNSIRDLWERRARTKSCSSRMFSSMA